MRQIVYADIVFLMNFCMDFLALFAAGKILGLKLSLPRLVLSSAFGAVYAVSTFFFDIGEIIKGMGFGGGLTAFEIIVNVSVSVAMCFIAFNIGSIIKFTKIFVIFYSACFMLGGGIEALYYLSGLVKTADMPDTPDISNTTNISGIHNMGMGGSNAPPVQVIIILAGICVFIIIIAGSIFRRKTSVKETEITIGFMGKETKVNAIVDSGNLLYEPISSLPVIIVKLGSVINLFDLKMLGLFVYDSPTYLGKKEFATTNAENMENINMLKKLKFRIVPVKSVAGENNILPAFSPDYIKLRTQRESFIKYREKKYRRQNKNNINNINKSDRTFKTFKTFEINAIIAVDGKSDKLNEKYGEKYGGIIPAALMDN